MSPPVPAGVFDVLDDAVAARPAATALVTNQGETTYSELDRLADAAAGALAGLGVRPGDRVGASLPNDLDIVVAFHGAMRLGAIWVGISRVLAAPEKAYMLADSGASVLLATDEIVDELAGKLDGSLHLLAADGWRDLVAGSAGRPDLPSPDPLAPAAIAYTSGTTGFPKGAVHCQAALVLPGAATVARRDWGPELRKGDSLPLTILNMLVLTTLLTAQARATAVVMDRADVASVVSKIRDERVTVWNGPPAQLHTMVHDETIDPGDLASLDEVWVGGGDCPDGLRAAFEERFGVPVARTYGLTEAPALVSIDDVAGARPPGTSGRPLEHIAVDSVEGEITLSPCASGRWAGLYRPLLGYWNKEEESAAVVSGSTLRTGDLGRVDESGHLRVLGRKSQLIIRGGANVYPAEVERVLSEAPGVEACAVVGVPDERLGERVGAVIETAEGKQPDTRAILAHCRVALASYKVPERIAFVEKLPRNQMGKVPRDAVLDLLSAPHAAKAAGHEKSKGRERDSGRTDR